MFEAMVADVQGFVRRLAAENTKAFFDANRGEYEAKMRDPGKALMEAVAPELEALTGHAVQGKLFRINRDVRFSKDKSPYNTHLHMLWTVAAGTRADPAFFFGIGTDYVTVGAGLMGFEKDVLEDWRRLAGEDGDWLRAPLEDVLAKGYRVDAPELKRVPGEWGQDHPHADLLRRKGLVVWGDLGAKAALPGDLLAACKDLWPVNDRLLSVAEAPVI